MLFLSPFCSITISTKPSSLSLVLSLFKHIIVNSFRGMLLVQLHPVARQPISPVSKCCSNCRGYQRWGGGCGEEGRWRERKKEESGRRQKVYNSRVGSKRGEDGQPGGRGGETAADSLSGISRIPSLMREMGKHIQIHSALLIASHTHRVLFS